MNNSAKQGLSLVQMSAILMVATIIMVSLLPGGKKGSDTEKSRITHERMRKIEDATQGFMTKNLRRPCPAAPNVAETDSEFGKERTDYGTCNMTSHGGLYASGLKPVYGAVPVRSLGLPDEYAYDGYGNRILYGVDKRATISTGGAHSCQYLQAHNSTGAIQIADDFTTINVKDNVMWVLISYGKDGFGSFSQGGARRDVTSNDNNTINNSFTAVAYGSPLIIVGHPMGDVHILNGSRVSNAESTAHFDDIVWYQEQTRNTCCLGNSCGS